MESRGRSVLAIVLMCLLAFPVFAQQQITRPTISGGGGTSTGGTFRLDGTIGQGILGGSSGGTISLAAGFWPEATAQCPTIAVNPTTATLPNGEVGVPYSQTFTASGGTGPYTFATTDPLPPGMTLASNGLLSGTPTGTGGNTFTFTVRVLDANSCNGSRAYSLSIQRVATTSVALNVTGTAYNATPTPGFFDGDFTLNTTLTNTGTATLNGPFTFRITTLTKNGSDQNPSQPNRVRTTDDFVLANPATGGVGSLQSLPGVTSLGIGASTPVSFTVGIGSRQSFTIQVDLLAVTPTGPARTLLTRRFEVNEAFVSSARPTVVGEGNFSAQLVGNTPLFAGTGVQTSPTIVTDPNNLLRVAAAATDTTQRTALVKLSDNAGQTWRDVVLPKSVNGVSFFSAQHPAVGYGSTGELFVAYTLANLNDAANALVWLRINADGTTTQPQLVASTTAVSQAFNVKPAIVSRGGLAWIAWEQVLTQSRESAVIVQPVGGVRQVPVTVARGQVGSPTLALGPKGQIYLGWEDFSGTGSLRMTVSETGVAFGPVRTIAATGLGAGRVIPAMPEQGARGNLSLAADETGVLSAAFVGVGTGLDVFLVQSMDNGASWSKPQAVTTAEGDQFLPALAVGGGQVTVAYFDTRLNRDGKADVFLTTISENGKSVVERRITSVASDATRTNALRDSALNLGLRIGTTRTGRGVVIVWTDTRSGSADVFSN